MKLRTLCLVVVVVCLVGVAAWRLMSGLEKARYASAVQQVPSEVDASGGTVGAVGREGTESEMHPAVFPIQRATTPAEVREVLRLTREATSQDLPALLDAALHAEDPLVAGNAVKALGRLKAFSSDTALLALTADPRLRVRQDAVTAAGLDGRAEALPYLERALAQDDVQLRPLVLEALGKIGGAAARALVQAVAEDSGASSTERVFARSALEHMQGRG